MGEGRGSLKQTCVQAVCVRVCTVVLGSTSVMASKLGTAVLSRDVLSPESNYDWALLVRAADSCLSMDKVAPRRCPREGAWGCRSQKALG